MATNPIAVPPHVTDIDTYIMFCDAQVRAAAKELALWQDRRGVALAHKIATAKAAAQTNGSN